MYSVLKYRELPLLSFFIGFSVFIRHKSLQFLIYIYIYIYIYIIITVIT